MSCGDDTDLREMLIEVLQENGSLAKIKAKLRSSVFLALVNENTKIGNSNPTANEKVRTSLEESEGYLMFSLVEDFLEYFNLKYTLSVFKSEISSTREYFNKGRSDLSNILKVNNEENAQPLLLNLLRQNEKYSSIRLPSPINKVENLSKIYEQTESFLEPIENNIKAVPSEIQLNATYYLNATNNSKILSTINDKENLTLRTIDSENHKDDTYEDTSSIAEDSIFECVDNDSMSRVIKKDEFIDNSKCDENIVSNSTEIIIDSEPCEISLHLNDNTLHAKHVKQSNNDSSLHKSKHNDTILLPSLYLKNFKDPQNVNDSGQAGSDNLELHEEDIIMSPETANVKYDDVIPSDKDC